jgi:hypothetical protein
MLAGSAKLLNPEMRRRRKLTGNDYSYMGYAGISLRNAS